MNKCQILISQYANTGEFGLDLFYPNIMDLLPLIMICSISILLIGVKTEKRTGKIFADFRASWLSDIILNRQNTHTAYLKIKE